MSAHHPCGVPRASVVGAPLPARVTNAPERVVVPFAARGGRAAASRGAGGRLACILKAVGNGPRPAAPPVGRPAAATAEVLPLRASRCLTTRQDPQVSQPAPDGPPVSRDGRAGAAVSGW